MDEDRRESQYRRVGDTAKCPACGVSMDPEAYRCPKCRIYFCFKCRRRVQPRDPQYQCMNQQCEEYGKLLCNACIVEVPQMGNRSRQELVEEGKNVNVVPGGVLLWLFVITIGIGFSAGLFFGLPWWGSLIAGAILGAIVAGYFKMEYGHHGIGTEYKAPVHRTITEYVEVGRSKCCIACKQAVEHIR